MALPRLFVCVRVVAGGWQLARQVGVHGRHGVNHDRCRSSVSVLLRLGPRQISRAPLGHASSPEAMDCQLAGSTAPKLLPEVQWLRPLGVL